VFEELVVTEVVDDPLVTSGTTASQLPAAVPAPTAAVRFALTERVQVIGQRFDEFPPAGGAVPCGAHQALLVHSARPRDSTPE
jgi:hypothetical protein